MKERRNMYVPNGHKWDSTCYRIKDLRGKPLPADSVAALIVNWNGSDDTNDLLHSLAATSRDEYPVGVFIVDNSENVREVQSILDVAETLSEHFIEITIFRCATNIGVPAAYNIAALLSEYKYPFLLRLDNDVILAEGGLSVMLKAMQNDPSLYVVGGNVKFFTNRDIDNGGAVSIDLRRGVTSTAYPSESCYADGVLGCIMLISGEYACRTAPLLHDPSLFLCTDESEVSLRAMEMGKRTWYVSSTVGYHKGGVSTSRVKFLSQYYSARNWTYLRARYSVGSDRPFIWIKAVCYALGHSLLKRNSAFPSGFLAGAALWLDRYFAAKAWKVTQRGLKQE